ncbi:hypothetical protein GIB67_026867 [Kingdonia uniflora]|uniref:Cupin type-1 domain-containing protein n=1 Tax=Kingdonia uniflora TaxID=39325 RepID=A0A7J7M7V0_9MAGN|nr:hypothetical protein GIB67_026867 [Kingdonia uniflora]
MARSSLLSLLLCFLVLVHAGVALATWQGQGQQGHQWKSGRRFQGQQNECRVKSIQALEPTNRIEAEGGVTEIWEQNNKQFECAGVAVTRYRIQPKGLLLPYFGNTPKLGYVVQGTNIQYSGRGIFGVVIPGCPETYQSVQQQSQQSEEEQGRQRSAGDQHQKIRLLEKGDIVATPAGVAKWLYNEGEEELIIVDLLDTSNDENQLDENPRKFYLAGNPQAREQQQQGQSQGSQGQQQERGSNIFRGFKVEVLAEAFGVSKETARKLQSEDDKRGNIVRVKGGLQVIRPPEIKEQAQQEEQEQEQQGRGNGIEETICSLGLKENIDNPSGADVFNPRGGRIRNLNSHNLPILGLLQLSAERGVLYRNALTSPHWNLNAHSLIYGTKGSAQIQIVGDYERPVFNGELREGQVLVVPQNFAVVKQAGDKGFEWIAFKTNNNAMTSTLAGRSSALRGIPIEVLMNAYRVNRDEARKLKNNRQELAIFSPRPRSQQDQGRATE